MVNREISKENLLFKLVHLSPFFIDEIIMEVNPKAEGKDYIRLQRRIYNLLKYYHSDNWICKTVEEGRRGRPRSRWSYIGDRK